MTWINLSTVNRNAIVILPIGAIEQHGPHLPVDTDFFITDAICKAVENRLSNVVLLAPGLSIGHSPHHRSFGGTLSLHHETLAKILFEVVQNFYSMGFSKILIINGHGGNQLPISMAHQEVKNRLSKMVLLSCSYWNLAREDLLSISDGVPNSMGHACELETSLYLYLNEEKVNKNLICDDGIADTSGYFGRGMFVGSSVSAVLNFSEITKNGVYGKPSLASKEKGCAAFTAIVDRIVEFIKHIEACEA